MHAVLAIGGSDSAAAAGIQADLKTIAAHGGYGLTVLTAVTAQSTRRVAAALPVPADLIAAQFEAVFEDFAVTAAKSGMLVDAQRVEAVHAALARWRPEHYVLDPVIASTSGRACSTMPASPHYAGICCRWRLWQRPTSTKPNG